MRFMTAFGAYGQTAYNFAICRGPARSLLGLGSLTQRPRATVPSSDGAAGVAAGRAPYGTVTVTL
eukprot:107835-Hanusia_phi.AAC.1